MSSFEAFEIQASLSGDFKMLTFSERIMYVPFTSCVQGGLATSPNVKIKI